MNKYGQKYITFYPRERMKSSFLCRDQLFISASRLNAALRLAAFSE